MTWVALAAVATALLGSAGDGEPYRRWIDALGSDRPESRDEAAASLRSAGRAAWTALSGAADAHDDPEVRARARDLLESSRLRRRLPYRILEDHPSALELLAAGAVPEKIRLVRTLGRHYDEAQDLLLDALRDPEAEVALAAAEALNENRNPEWIPRLLELFALEDCPRAGRMHDLLSSNSSRLPAAEIQKRFDSTGPRGRNRFIHLALHTGLPLAVSAPELLAMLRHGDLPARRAALAWTRDRSVLGAAPEIELLLAASSPVLVADALATLRHLRFRPDADRLSALLGHEHPLVRDEAALAVAAFDEKAALPALRPLLQDPSTAVRQTAIQTLWKLLSTDALDELLGLYLRDSGESREQAAALLHRHHDWSLPRARTLLQNPDPELRLRGAELLARIEGPASIPPLARDRDESVRRWALQQLIRADLPAAVESLEILARDESESIRFEALRTLVRRRRLEHVPALERFLVSPEYSLRHDAAETILEFAGDRALELARGLLAETDPSFRRLALGALSRRPDARTAGEAFEAIDHPDGRLRRTAALYLNESLKTARDAALVARLAAALASLEGEPLSLAFRLVVDHGDRASSPALKTLVLAGRAPNADRAVRAVAEWAGEQAPAELGGFLGSDPALNEIVFVRVREARRRHAAADARLFAVALRPQLAHADPRVRRSAAGAAEEFGLSEALADLVGDSDPSVRHAAIAACARAGIARAAGSIVDRLDDEDPDVRVAAVQALSRLRPDSVTELRKVAAQEEVPWTRRRMEFALQGVAGR